MRNNTPKTLNEAEEITRKDAIKKIGTYGKYAALTALGTYSMLTPMRAQVGSILNQTDLG
jgi:hypothetical protein